QPFPSAQPVQYPHRGGRPLLDPHLGDARRQGRDCGGRADLDPSSPAAPDRASLQGRGSRPSRGRLAVRRSAESATERPARRGRRHRAPDRPRPVEPGGQDPAPRRAHRLRTDGRSPAMALSAGEASPCDPELAPVIEGAFAKIGRQPTGKLIVDLLKTRDKSQEVASTLDELWRREKGTLAQAVRSLPDLTADVRTVLVYQHFDWIRPLENALARALDQD